MPCWHKNIKRPPPQPSLMCVHRHPPAPKLTMPVCERTPLHAPSCARVCPKLKKNSAPRKGFGFATHVTRPAGCSEKPFCRGRKRKPWRRTRRGVSISGYRTPYTTGRCVCVCVCMLIVIVFVFFFVVPNWPTSYQQTSASMFVFVFVFAF